ncbi:MAG: ROK family protein [Cyclobacteriaceae bacterium]|nr:ROK family protein [Cyclobacteriaceae bacterium]
MEVDNKQILWGIDLGGTKIEGVVLAYGDQPKVIERHRIPTEKEKGYHHIIDRIAILIDEISNKTGMLPERLGIGTPGFCVQETGLMKNCNTTSLIGQPLPKDLEQKLGIPVFIENDANCFALAEAVLGVVRSSMKNARMVFGVILGTGVGGGLVFDKKVWQGRQGIAGEWGHNFLDESGGNCYCGKTGCVETVLCGPALEKFYKDHTGKYLKLSEIHQRSKTGNDPAAKQTIDRLTREFAKAIAYVINILDPDAIVIGGGVGNIDDLYSKCPELLREYVFNDKVETRLLKPELGDSAGVLGAALLGL